MTLWPWSLRCLLSLAIEVVLPAPFTPATSTTVGPEGARTAGRALAALEAG